MPTLYLTEDRALVRRDTEDCLLVQVPEMKGEEVVVLGEVTITASAFQMLLEKNIEIHFLNALGQFKGKLSPGLSKNSLLRLAQHRTHHDIKRRCELAKRFVIGKLSNQRTMLQRSNRRLSDEQVS